MALRTATSAPAHAGRSRRLWQALRKGRLLAPRLKATAAGWMRDNAMRLSAALVLYAIQSLAALRVGTAKIVGVVIADASYARTQIESQIASLMGPQVA